MTAAASISFFVVLISVVLFLAPSALSQTGNIDAQIFTDSGCQTPYQNFSQFNYSGVSLNSAICHSATTPNGNLYSFMINCSNAAGNQYFYENIFFNTSACNSTTYLNLTHVGGVSQCNLFQRTIVGPNPGNFNITNTLYSNLICSTTSSGSSSSSSSSSSTGSAAVVSTSSSSAGNDASTQRASIFVLAAVMLLLIAQVMLL